MPFSPRGIEQSLVLPPRWSLILYTELSISFLVNIKAQGHFGFGTNVPQENFNKWFWNHESRLNIHQVCGYSDSFFKKLK